MRNILLTAVTAFLIGGIATGAVLSQAQTAPPAPEAATSGPPPHFGMPGWRMARDGGPGPGMMGGRPGFHHHHNSGRSALGLIYRQPDRQLAPADVQKIVEGFLLWNGNHRWKVADVQATPDGPIAFSLTTTEGSVIAKFTMDPHNGRIARIG